MGYSENERGEVTLTMIREDWSRLLILFGYAIGSAYDHGNKNFGDTARGLLNRLNDGNPNFSPEYNKPDN